METIFEGVKFKTGKCIKSTDVSKMSDFKCETGPLVVIKIGLTFEGWESFNSSNYMR